MSYKFAQGDVDLIQKSFALICNFEVQIYWCFKFILINM